MMGTEKKYPHNVLQGFDNGCLLDLRVRFAMSMLTHSPLFTGGEGVPKVELIAKVALDVAQELFSQAEARGWIDPIPESAELDADLRDQAKRTAEFQARQQVHGNGVATKLMNDAAPAVVTPGQKRTFGMQ